MVAQKYIFRTVLLSQYNNVVNSAMDALNFTVGQVSSNIHLILSGQKSIPQLV